MVSFPDRINMAAIRDLGFWSAKNQVKPLAGAVLDAFGERPEVANLPVIKAISDVFIERPIASSESDGYIFLITLAKHRFAETIPLMAPFATEAYPQQLVHEFLTRMSGVDLGNDPKAWIAWYEAHKKQLGVED